MLRNELIEFLTQQIEGIKKSNRPLLVCIDGVDTSGKTTLCNGLANFLSSKGHSVIKASIDGFHNPAEKRYRLGSKSPEGYYRDSFDYYSLNSYLLEPLKSGNLEYRSAVYDFKTESKVEQVSRKADMGSILLMEGVFLHRPELIANWDLSVFLHIDFEQVIARAKARDQYLFGSEVDVEMRYRNKYIPGQQIYLNESKPYKSASIVIDNNNFNNPVVLKDFNDIEELRRRAFDFR
jgi:uridine kinase